MHEKAEHSLSPIRKASTFLGLLARPRFVRKLGTLVTEGYLAKSGWVRSVLEERIVDAVGRPLPWMTQPFIDFIEPRLHKGLYVFEYGSGASTLYFARRVGCVLAVDHDAAFAATLSSQLSSNAQVVVCDEGSNDYINAIVRLEHRPHLVSVDGRDRVRCMAAAMCQLAQDGVLVLDDAERFEYVSGLESMKAAGFRSLEFWGLASGRVERKCTMIFYRSGNILGV